MSSCAGNGLQRAGSSSDSMNPMHTSSWPSQTCLIGQMVGGSAALSLRIQERDWILRIDNNVLTSRIISEARSNRQHTRFQFLPILPILDILVLRAGRMPPKGAAAAAMHVSLVQIPLSDCAV